MNSKICHKIRKNKDKKKDIVYTPVNIAKDLIKLCSFNDKDVLLDPCKGTGAFFDNFPKTNKKLWCEIQEKKDFFKFSKKVDWIITNPPYSILSKWLKKSMEISNKGIALLVNNMSITPIRLLDMEAKGWYITKIHMFKIHSWFGYQYFVIWEKLDKKCKIDFTFCKRYSE